MQYTDASGAIEDMIALTGYSSVLAPGQVA